MSTIREKQFFLPYDRRLVRLAKEMRKNPTPAERKLWEYLRTFPFRVWRQRPISYFIVDFYCPKLKLAIEVDGAGHFTVEGMARDRERTQILHEFGLQVVRFTNDEVMNNIEGVFWIIEGYLPF